ncbi:hypothetical protein BH10PSE19_BH10PSE19_04820 [soil metagenome]
MWRLDRWGRSVSDLVGTLKELSELDIGFISLIEALDMTTATGRAMAGLLAVFAEFERDLLRERVKAEIARQLNISRTSVGALLTNKGSVTIPPKGFAV